MTEQQPTEHVEFSDQDEKDLASLGITTGEEPNFHTILEVWLKVLEPAHDELGARVTPQYANRIVSTYQDIAFADMIAFRDRFYGKILELEEILKEIVASDPDALTYTSPEEDRAENSKHYRTALLEWQKRFLEWELAWETTDPLAGVELGAISECHNMFFGSMGLTAQLQNIQFEYTEQDQAAVQDALQAMRDGGDGE